MFERMARASARRLSLSALALALALMPAFAAAQTPPAPGSPTPEAAPTPSPSPTPDDTPSLRAGATIFADYTYTQEPMVKDADGNLIHSSAFDVTRAYLNAAGTLSHLLSFRVTADVRRLTSATAAPATAIDGSLTYRLKYAYGQVSLDHFLPKDSWVRLGAQPTPQIDYEEGIYRYRFQGTQMLERDGYLSSSDFGITSRVSLPKNYGDLHFGVYNGETYGRPEANDQKAFQIRGTLRPLPGHEVLKGLRLTAFYDADRYIKGAPRNRFVMNAAFEHKYVVAAADLLEATDQVSVRAPKVESSAYSVWTRLKTTMGVEGLLRYDSVRPDKTVDGRRNRTILGVSYWFKTRAPVATAVLADYERVNHPPASARPRETRLALHTLFSF